MKTYLIAASRELAIQSIMDNDLPGGTIPLDSAEELKGLHDCVIYGDSSLHKVWADHRILMVLQHYDTYSPDIDIVYLD